METLKTLEQLVLPGKDSGDWQGGEAWVWQGLGDSETYGDGQGLWDHES